MDKKELQEKIALYYSKLPANAQTVFSSMTWLETLKKISRKYGLDDKQQETLGTETTLVLLGIIHLVEYEEILTNDLGLYRDAAEQMMEEIEVSIIQTIRPQLVEAYEANIKSEEGLSKEIKNVVDNSNYKSSLYTISRGYNLTVIQMGSLEKSVTDLINGTIHPEEFESSLKQNLGLPIETVQKLTSEVNEKIFKKIRKGLIKKTEENKLFEGKNDQVLNQAGIEVVESAQQGSARTAEVKPETREEILQKIERPEEVANLELPEIEAPHPILLQKLSAPVKTETTTTEHSLGNISKKETPKAYPPKADPYRLSPDE